MCARAVRLGSSGGLNTGLLAIGPDIVCTGILTGVSAGTWTLRLEHFLVGDMHAVIDFIDAFDRQSPAARYIRDGLRRWSTWRNRRSSRTPSA